LQRRLVRLLYISPKIPLKCHKITKKEREGGEEKDRSEVEVGEEVAKLCQISQFRYYADLDSVCLSRLA
jgi:hypothetical protein